MNDMSLHSGNVRIVNNTGLARDTEIYIHGMRIENICRVEIIIEPESLVQAVLTTGLTETLDICAFTTSTSDRLKQKLILKDDYLLSSVIRAIQSLLGIKNG